MKALIATAPWFPGPGFLVPIRNAELFEEAKFSEHAIGEEMRERAVDALGAVRDEVREA